MNKEKYVFAQLISFLNEDKFRRIVNKFQGNRYIKHFTCWNQLLSLMFGQLSNRESLRDLIIALDAHHSKCYHLGIGRNVSRSSLARANQDRDYHIFEEYAYYLINEARQKRATEILNSEGTSMPSIRQPLICVWPYSGGQNSARKKVISKYIHYTMWKHRYLHSFISLKRQYTIQRQSKKSRSFGVLPKTLSGFKSIQPYVHNA